ncbi:hypothetical protein PO909_027220 [Leuciscus waleckii]
MTDPKLLTSSVYCCYKRFLFLKHLLFFKKKFHQSILKKYHSRTVSNFDNESSY